jgi:putative zinc finger/helix-turn-helix YgiT family protein
MIKEKQQNNCPNEHGSMVLRETEQQVTFRGVELTVKAIQYVCETCSIEVATIKQAGAMQRKIADLYRAKKGLMTGQEIKGKRKDLKISQKNLADIMSVGIASIKRWEGGIIQTPAMDKLLRMAFWPKERETTVTGNRPFSIERVKCVLLEFNALFRYDLFKAGDKLSYSAKPLWYADMVAHRELGRSITGATYAALPQGPQLNNYSELAPYILQSDEKKAEPLTPEEKRIIKRVYEKFPEKIDAYNASHREVIWKSKNKGEIIPYVESAELTEM